MPLREVECVTCRGEASRAVTLQPATNGNQHTAAFLIAQMNLGLCQQQTWQQGSRLCSCVYFDMKKEEVALVQQPCAKPIILDCEVIEEKDC